MYAFSQDSHAEDGTVKRREAEEGTFLLVPFIFVLPNTPLLNICVQKYLLLFLLNKGAVLCCRCRWSLQRWWRWDKEVSSSIFLILFIHYLPLLIFIIILCVHHEEKEGDNNVITFGSNLFSWWASCCSRCLWYVHCWGCL